MHNNYYFLRQLSDVLDKRTRDYRLVSCFSQNKDELVIELNDGAESFFIKGNFSSSFCCLSFPSSFSRARKNSADLFPEIILKHVSGVRQYNNERSFSLTLDDDLHLLFKMHGNRANVVLMKGNTATAMFRNHLKADLEIVRDAIDRTIDWSKETFFRDPANAPQRYFTLGKRVWETLDARGYESTDVEGKWNLLQGMLSAIEQPSYYVCSRQGAFLLLLFPEGEVVRKFEDPLAAINEFYALAISHESYESERTPALRSLLTRQTATAAFIRKSKEQLSTLEQDDHFRQWADLIMANIHTLKAGDEKVMLENFYDEGKLTEVSLKKTLSPQKNAELYYRKSKNQEIERSKLREIIAIKEQELQRIAESVNQVTASSDLRGLRKTMADRGLAERNEEKQPELLPYREYEYKSFKIWVGRNAESNDKLTQKYSYKDDLWLHAKDVAGSHVLIKHQSGKPFPKDVIEYAAALAAFNSKRKNETLCPVAYTLKKNVRKRKGDPAGMVVVERETVVLVEPGKGTLD